MSESPCEASGLTGLLAYRLWFQVEATDYVSLGRHAGQRLRGALFATLRRHECGSLNPDGQHKRECPVCWLMATEDAASARGKDVPRPYTVEPPSHLHGDGNESGFYRPGERFSFGITLFGRALDLVAYVIVGLNRVGQQEGIGTVLAENGDRRGHFNIRRIEMLDEGEKPRAIVYDGSGRARIQRFAVDATAIGERCQSLMGEIENGRLTIRFLTPTRIVDQGQLVHVPLFGPLFRRLSERLEALAGEYGNCRPQWDIARLLEAADRVQLIADHTHWSEVRSYSRRLRRETPLSGYLGEATYLSSEWPVLLPYLVWGENIHVGKSATRGCGWYRIIG